MPLPRSGSPARALRYSLENSVAVLLLSGLALVDSVSASTKIWLLVGCDDQSVLTLAFAHQFVHALPKSYSMTSVASLRMLGGTVMPDAFQRRRHLCKR